LLIPDFGFLIPDFGFLISDFGTSDSISRMSEPIAKPREKPSNPQVADIMASINIQKTAKFVLPSIRLGLLKQF
jgi:hypothetical protein